MNGSVRRVLLLLLLALAAGGDPAAAAPLSRLGGRAAAEGGWNAPAVLARHCPAWHGRGCYSFSVRLLTELSGQGRTSRGCYRAHRRSARRRRGRSCASVGHKSRVPREW